MEGFFILKRKDIFHEIIISKSRKNSSSLDSSTNTPSFKHRIYQDEKRKREAASFDCSDFYYSKEILLILTKTGFRPVTVKPFF